jgi:DNA repair/transcription protein MET18/MMS19
MDSLIEDYVINRDRTLEIPKQLAGNVSNGSVKIVTIVEQLGKYLTSTEISKRALGTQLLSKILTNLNEYHLLVDEVYYLVMFYCDRLKDTPSVTPHVLEGLLSMVTHQKLSSKDVVNIIRSINRELHNQSLPQSDRKMVYMIYYTLLTNYISDVKLIGSEFVLCYIQAMDGEKDPRNLLIVFSSIPIITRQLDISVLTEELFEVISCYFPINFTPVPSTDFNSISKESLSLGLCNSLVSTPKFAELSIMLCLDKLSSDLHSSKLDSLLVLAAGFPVFGSKSLLPHMEVLWLSLMKEIFQPVGRNIEQEALNVLTSLSKALSSDDNLNQLLSLIHKDCGRHLCEPEFKLMKPAAMIVIAVAKGCIGASLAVIKQFLPLLTQQIIRETTMTSKQLIIEVVLNLIKTIKLHNSNDAGTCFAEHFKPLLPVLLSLLFNNSHTPLIIIVMATLSSLIELHYLPAEHVEECVKNFMTLASGHSEVPVRDEAVKSLGIISRYNQSIISDCVLPIVLELKDVPLCLDIIKSVSTTYNIITVTLTHLIKALEEGIDDKPEDYLVLISDAVHVIISASKSQSETVTFIHLNILPNIINLCVSASCSDVILDHLSSSIYHHMLSLDINTSIDYSNCVINSFITNDVSSYLNITSHLSVSPWQQRGLISILISILRSCFQESLEVNGIKLLTHLIQFVLSQLDSSFPSLYRGIACLSNKLPDNNEFIDVINQSYMNMWSVVSDPGYDNERRLLALHVILWMTKGLVVRSHILGINASTKLMSLYEDQVTSKYIPNGFHIILSDSDNTLTIDGHADIKLFYRQRLFGVCVPKLIDMFHSYNSSIVRESILTTLSHFMQLIPKQVLTPFLPKLFPLLMTSLDVSPVAGEDSLIISSVEALRSLVLESPDIINLHVATIISLLLKLAMTHPKMSVRAPCVKCINALCSLPPHLTYPHRVQVLNGLDVCLDDKKRLVRKEAVECRSKWYFLNTD